MINRVLIRIKVVQMLYSYLLTRSDFKILPEPESRSRDKRYAYALYSDLLLLLLDVSGFKITNFDGRPRVEQISAATPDRRDVTSIARSIGSDDLIPDIALRRRNFYSSLAPLAPALRAAVREADIYKQFQRKRDTPEIQDEIQLWKVIFRSVLLRDEKLQQLLRSNEDFTHVGYEQGLAMFEATLDDYTGTRSALIDAKRSLAAALDKSYELYMSLLMLMIDLTDERARQLDEGRHKYVPTDDDLNPNTRFVDNRFIAALRENNDLKAYRDDNPVSWADDVVMLRRLLDRILASETYKKYMAAPKQTWEGDCDLWLQLMRNVIIDSDELAEELENKSIYWNDDLNIMGSFVIKTTKAYAQAGESRKDSVSLSPKYKDMEDERFGPKLFEAVVRNAPRYRAIVDSHLVNTTWDPERMAFMDVVILVTAIAELLNFPSIPTLVTVNEYTEIANYYSTIKSGAFVTGMLYSIIATLRTAGELNKD